jgi:hypothetical protein
MQLLAYRKEGYIRRMKKADGSVAKAWYWTPFTYFLGHGGWFYFDIRRPLETARFWWRHGRA